MKSKKLSDQEQSVQNYLNSIGVLVQCVYVGEDTRDDNWKCDAWKFTINNGKHNFTFDYFTGLGHRELSEMGKCSAVALRNVSKNSIAWIKGVEEEKKPVLPAIAGLLYSMILDGQACESSFEDWCAYYGYNTDSRKALETYLLCQDNGVKYHKLFTVEQREKLEEILQDY